MRKILSNMAIEQSAAILLAMANPKRLEILNLLASDEMPVGTIADTIGLSQSALSQHLAKLRAEKLVNTRREAQTIYYSSRSAAVRGILTELEKVFTENAERKSARRLALR